MSLDLIRADLPARVHYKTKDGGHGQSIIVFVYSDGKVLTASALVLDPSDWTDVEVRKSQTHPIASPPWAGKTNEELTEHYNSEENLGLGKFVDDVHAPISESAEEIEVRGGLDERIAERNKPKLPRTIRRVTGKDEVSDDAFLGKETA